MDQLMINMYSNVARSQRYAWSKSTVVIAHESVGRGLLAARCHCLSDSEREAAVQSDSCRPELH